MNPGQVNQLVRDNKTKKILGMSDKYKKFREVIL